MLKNISVKKNCVKKCKKVVLKNFTVKNICVKKFKKKTCQKICVKQISVKNTKNVLKILVVKILVLKNIPPSGFDQRFNVNFRADDDN